MAAEDAGSYTSREELDLFHITLPLDTPEELVDWELVEFFNIDFVRGCLCSGGVGGKVRSEISKLSLKLFDRARFSGIDVEDMSMVSSSCLVREQARITAGDDR